MSNSLPQSRKSKGPAARKPAWTSPVGGGNYSVREGDCIASIALDHGFFWQTIWEDAGNAQLHETRGDPYTLLPGDKVFIPEKRLRTETGGTEQRHRFRRRGVPEKLRILFLESSGEPRKDWAYRVVIDGANVAQGNLDSSGELSCSIPPNANSGVICLTRNEVYEEFELTLGTIDPIDSVSGVQARLINLGFPCGAVNGVFGPETAKAVAAFQESQDLVVSGEIDEKTRIRLRQLHGF